MNLTKLPGLSSKRLEALAKEGIASVTDLLNFFPRRYLDRSNVQLIHHLMGAGEEITVTGEVTLINEVGFGKKKRLEVTIKDESGVLKGVWFRGASYFKNIFKKGEVVAFFGAAKRYGKNITIAHPEVDKISDESDLEAFSRIMPVYPGSKEISKARITSSLFQSWVKVILDQTELPEFLPQYILEELKLPQRKEAYRMIHFPENHGERKKALERFKFEELFMFELSMEKIHHTIEERKSGQVFSELGNYTSRYFNELIPFKLTDGQKTSLADIKKDVRSGRQMNRLIQGDDGAGKTIVAIGALLMA